MTDKLFDDFIKDKLKDHSSNVPAGMWDRILQEKNKKKVGFAWWKSLGLLALLICTAVIFGLFGPLDQLGKKDEAVSAKPTIERAPANVEQNSTATRNSLNEPQGNPATAPATGPNAETNAGIASPSDNSAADNEPGNNNEATVQQGKSVDAQTLLQSKRKSRSNNNNLQQASSNEGIPDLTPNEESAEDFKKFADRNALIASFEKGLINSNAEAIPFKQQTIFPFPGVDCPSNKVKGDRGFYIEFFASPDIASKSMELKGQGNNGYVKSKDSTESRQLSYTLGVRFTKEISNRLLFRTGLQYSSINEKFSYRNENERSRTTVVTIRTIVRGPNDTIRIRDTSIVEQIGYRVKTTYNHYRSYDLPIIFGYQLGGENWKASLNTGVILNLSSWQQGEFLDTSYIPTSFEKTSTPIFKRKIGMGLYFAASYAHAVGPRTELFAEPYVRYNLSNLTTDSSPFSQRFNVAGVLLGIRFKLNGPRATK